MFRQERQCAPILTIDTTFDCQQQLVATMDPSTCLAEIARLTAARRRQQAIAVAGGVSVFTAMLIEEDSALKSGKRKKRKSRTARRLFDCQSAFKCIERDFIGDNALFSRDFKSYFRLSRTRVQKLLEDFAKLGSRNPFYQPFRRCTYGRIGASLEVKILLPLKVIAFGVAPHAFSDYFQVSIPMARECHRQFLAAIRYLYSDEYLRLPDAKDLRNILSLHGRVHGVPGMLGSLDCMQTRWKNCPIGWQQSFKGRSKGMATIVLEAACDYNLWFWHAAYGFSGALNDGNVLSLSPLLDRMTNGTFSLLEKEAGVVPFIVEGTEEGFNNTYFLVDGIYPRYTRFVKAMLHPSVEEDCRYTKWQESARKDIERAFGVMQARFKSICNPIYLMDEESIYNLVACCLVMHNMCVQERIMGNCDDRYDPSIEADPEQVPPATIAPGIDNQLTIDNTSTTNDAATVDEEEPPPPALFAEFNADVTAAVLRKREWLDLVDPVEWSRLQAALIGLKGFKRNSPDD